MRKPPKSVPQKKFFAENPEIADAIYGTAHMLPHAITPQNNTFFPLKNSKFEPDIWVFSILKTHISGSNFEFLSGKKCYFVVL